MTQTESIFAQRAVSTDEDGQKKQSRSPGSARAVAVPFDPSTWIHHQTSQQLSQKEQSFSRDSSTTSPMTSDCFLFFPLHVSPAKLFTIYSSVLRMQIPITHEIFLCGKKLKRTEITLTSSDLWCKRAKKKKFKNCQLTRVFCLACIVLFFKKSIAHILVSRNYTVMVIFNTFAFNVES